MDRALPEIRTSRSKWCQHLERNQISVCNLVCKATEEDREQAQNPQQRRLWMLSLFRRRRRRGPM
jgi:hypothetical protein